MRLGLLCGLILMGTVCAAQQPAVHMRDGGTREVMESIYIPPLAHAPFMGMLATEWSRPLAGGGSITLVNRRRVARDGNGRIYEERWGLVPKGGRAVSEINYTQIADPTQHTLYNCQVSRKICHLELYDEPLGGNYRKAVGVSGPLLNGEGYHLHEELGSGTTIGVNTIGYRETTTINAGVAGNDQPMVSLREFWYAPELGVNLLSKVETPQTGRQVFTFVELSTSEPDPQLFELPEGYAVVDERKGEAQPQ